MGKCKSWWQPYFKVLIVTIISFSGISGIYSFLSRAGKLELLPDGTKVNIWSDRTYQGIYCDSTNINSDLNCDTIAQRMANNITSNPSWDCHARLNYSSLFKFENQHFTLIFVLLIIFAFISAFFTVIHDWRLIKHRQDMTKMTRWFPNHQDSLLFDYVCCWKCCSSNNDPDKDCDKQMIERCNNSKCIICLIIWFFITRILLAVVGVALALVQAIFIPLAFIFLRPCFCCSKSSWNRFMDFNGYLCEISYFWLGIAKFGLMIMTVVLTYYGFIGFNVFIGEITPLYSYSTCNCYCHYILPPTNFYGLMIVTYLLMFDTLSFFYQHAFESIPYKLDYLLTKKYIQPMNYDGNTLDVLRRNPMQTILYQYKKNDDDNKEIHIDSANQPVLLHTKESDINLGDEDKDVNKYTAMEDDGLVLQWMKDETKKNKNTSTKNKGGCLCCAYGTMFVLGVILMLFFTALGFIAIGISNANNWPHWVAMTIMWIGIVVASVFILFFAVVLCTPSR